MDASDCPDIKINLKRRDLWRPSRPRVMSLDLLGPDPVACALLGEEGEGDVYTR